MADTPQQFAARIRAKHPGAYDDMNDNELTMSVINKHPEYRDLVNAQAKEPIEDGALPIAANPLGQLSSINEMGRSLLEKAQQGVAGTMNNPEIAGPKVQALGHVLGSALGMGAEAINPTTKLGQATMLAAPFAMGAASGIGNLSKNLAGNETMAQGMTTSMGGIERNHQAILNDPSILSRAKPVEQASEDYANRIPGLQGLVDYIRGTSKKSVPTFGDFTKTLDESKANIASGSGTLQDALNQVQSVNKIMAHKEFTKDPSIVRGLMQDREDAINLLEQSNPGFAEANKGLREAHLSDFYNNWFPQNKNGTPSVLRGFVAAKNAAQGVSDLAQGSPIAGATRLGAAAISSPKLAGMGLRTLNTLGKEVGGVENPATLDELSNLSEQIAEKQSNAQYLRSIAKNHEDYVHMFNTETGLGKPTIMQHTNPMTGVDEFVDVGNGLPPGIEADIAKRSIKADELHAKAQKAEDELADLHRQFKRRSEMLPQQNSSTPTLGALSQVSANQASNVKR